MSDSHVIAGRVASCSDFPVNYLTILSAASPVECTQTATSLRLHVSMFGVQMKSWQERHIFSVELVLDTAHAGGARIINHDASLVSRLTLDTEGSVSSYCCAVAELSVRWTHRDRHWIAGPIFPWTNLQLQAADKAHYFEGRNEIP
jgi:hypothetical protein